MLRLSSALLALGYLSQAEAFWRMPCKVLTKERLDPIVSPGGVSGHVHNVVGGSNFAATTSFDTLQKSECTSCQVTQDLSNYWVPELYFQYGNGSFEAVDGGDILVYYLQRGDTANEKIHAFPDGLRMISGDPFLRSYTKTLEQQAINFVCLRYSAGEKNTETNELPNSNCEAGLRSQVAFPSCWNGKDLDSPDHKSHMAFPSGITTGKCPSTHPVRLITIFYEVFWNVDKHWAKIDQAMNKNQPFVFAQGDSTGYGYHGDFSDGWDKKVLQEAIDVCTYESGVIEECKIFDLHYGDCKKTPSVNEVAVGGLLPKLPGCNPVTGFGERAKSCSADSTPAFFENPVAYNTTMPPPGSENVGNVAVQPAQGSGFNFKSCWSDRGTRTLSKSVNIPDMTVQKCLTACAAEGARYCGMEYGAECWMGSTLSSSSSALDYGSCGKTCAGNNLEYCGGSNALSLYELDPSAPIPSGAMSSIAASSTASSASPSASSASASLVRSTDTYEYSSCLSYTGSRPVSTRLSLSDPTVEKCHALCAAGNFQYCALEYGGECYGSNFLADNTSIQDVSRCGAMTCSGDKTQFCGAGSTILVYKSKTGGAEVVQSGSNFVYRSCWSDSASRTRTLSRRIDIADMTVEKCLAACASNKAALCGLEYGQECWMSTESTLTGAALPDSSCSMTCKGSNGKQLCGGPDALQLYGLGPHLVNAADSYQYSACVPHGQTRPLSTRLALSNPTVEGCAALAAAGGFKYFGLEYGGECWADNFLASSESQDVSKCAMTCSGDKSQFCGAANSLLVYKSDSVGAAVVPSGNGFTYQSCWSDSASKTRTLTRRIDLPQMTVEKCLAACAANKAVLCGLEYGQECWMSTDSTLTGSALPAESCSMTCIGSAGTQFCGGRDALQLYKS